MEADVAILNAISNVNTAKIASAASMVGCEASPNIVSYNGNLIGCVFLNAPAALRKIAHNIIQEVSLENCIIFKQHLLLDIVLAVSEVRVVIDSKDFLGIETSESDVSLDFMGLSKTVGTLRANLAVILNSHDCV